MSKEQTALERIKDEVALEHYGSSVSCWDEAMDRYPSTGILKLWPIVCERFARECCQATLEKAARNANVHPDRLYENGHPMIDKSSITNKNNIVIL